MVSFLLENPRNLDGVENDITSKVMHVEKQELQQSVYVCKVACILCVQTLTCTRV